MEALVGTVPCDGGRQSNDLDDDGVCDFLDNCTLVANGAGQACEPGSCTCTNAPCNGNQIDSDSDGFGNVCDLDYNNDAGVGGPEFNSLRTAFGANPGDVAYEDGRFDSTNDGSVGGPEFNSLRVSFGSGFPGPSGYACKQLLFETEAAPGGRKLVFSSQQTNTEWNGTSCPP